jgi:hypothetical protein
MAVCCNNYRLEIMPAGTIHVTIGGNIVLTPIIYDVLNIPQHGQTITLTSSNSNIASISGYSVTGIAIGSATITASGTNVTATAIVQVGLKHQ